MGTEYPIKTFAMQINEAVIRYKREVKVGWGVLDCLSLRWESEYTLRVC